MLNNSGQVKAISSKQVRISGGFWGERQTVNRQRTIPAIYRQMEETGQLEALNLKRTHPNTRSVIYMFWDSDPAKWLEAVGYSLQSHPDPALEAQADDLVARMAKAQQPDGYLNSYFSVLEPENRWRNLRDWHELYNAGHLIEGAVAYAQATGKQQVLDILSRYADLIDMTFGPNEDQKHGYPGHPELELALVKLYHATGEKRYLNLSKYFIDERGKQPSYFDQEAAERGDDPSKFWAKTYHYCQAHTPIREQSGATGHSVRACYLYAGVADIAAETGDASLVEASRRFWDDLTQHQMYITGGLGPAHTNEGFTFAYDLPNESAYAETCASCALVFWAQRMFHLEQHGRYIDVMERALYNGVMSGVSFDGEEFFYANPLVSYPHVNPYEHWSGIHTAEHYRRSEWFFCACCPPNLARLVANIGEYVYSQSEDTLYVNLYTQNQMSFSIGGSDVEISQQTNYPWDGEVQLSIQTNQPTQFDLALRIPGWCANFSISINGAPAAVNTENGYVHLSRTWAAGDIVTLSLAMPVERIVANPNVRQDAGCIALQRGPVVYCLEQVDNGAQLANVTIPRESKLSVTMESTLFGGIAVIKGEAKRTEPTDWNDSLYQPQSQLKYDNQSFTFTAIPYCFWANREPGEMRVWVREY
ncbi:MAG: glycoside hydrolase family 127 protein [Anaerolineae bacterium]